MSMSRWAIGTLCGESNMAGIMQAPGRCNCGPSCTLDCRFIFNGSYCSVSAETLYLSWTGGGPVAMACQSANSRWITANFMLAGKTVYAVLACSSGYFQLSIIEIGYCSWLGSNNQFGTCSCSPFHIDAPTANGTGAPSICGVFIAAGITDFYVDI